MTFGFSLMPAGYREFAGNAGAFFAHLFSSTAPEAGNELVGLAGIDQPDGGQCPATAPGAPIDHKAWRTVGDVQRCCGGLVSQDSADRMLGLRPWDMMQQPGAG